MGVHSFNKWDITPLSPQVDIILTEVEQGIEEEGEGHELKTQLERARMHLNTVSVRY